MEENKETQYRFNGDEALKKSAPDKAFYIVKEEVIDGKKKKLSKSISVGMIHASGGPAKFYIHAFIYDTFKEVFKGLKYEITEEDYKLFQTYKGDKRRINLFVKASKGEVIVKKKSVMRFAGIRMTEDLYEELSANAKQCNMTFSDYCRTLLQGKTPTVALTQNEMATMQQVVQFRTDVMKFAGAYFSVLRGIPNKDRPYFIVTGESFGFWRDYIKKGLICLERLIEKCK